MPFLTVSPECRFCMPAPESHHGVASLRRRKLRITHFRVNTKNRSLCCDSSPQKVCRLFGDPVFIGRLWQGHISFGRLFSCHGTMPLTYSQWEGRFVGVFFKKLEIIPSLIPSENSNFVSLFLNYFYPSIYSDWERRFGEAVLQKD